MEVRWKYNLFRFVYCTADRKDSTRKYGCRVKDCYDNRMASGDLSHSGLVQKLSPLVKSGQVFSKSVQNGGDFQLVKSAYKLHTSPTPVRASVAKEIIDSDEKDGRQKSEDGSLTRFVRRRTDSIDSQGSVEEELILLRRKVEQQEQSLESLKLSILSVREESTCQREMTGRVQTKFRSHRALIDRTLRQTQLAMQEQQNMLTRQEVLIKSIEREQSMGSSVFLESAYILLGMYIIQTPLVKYTVHLISVNVDRRGRHTKWLPRFVQVVFFMHFVKLCRALSSHLGFSSGIQSVFSWMRTSLTGAISRLTGFKQNMLTYDSPSYKKWVRSTEENRQGFNILDQHRLINTAQDTSSSNTLNIC